jgi:hypothetical protein
MALPSTNRTPRYDVMALGNVLNYTTKVMHLTCGHFLKQLDWTNWQESKFLQLDQYNKQHMFGDPVATINNATIFYLVWTYNIKTLDGHKKACCGCNGLTRSSSVQVLDETYANCVDQTSSCLFYAIAAAENLVVYSADVCNAFAEAPPPKQELYVHPSDWWILHKKCLPIPEGHVIPILSTMQGHPESPRLWEKHADNILCNIGLTQTVHKPCLCSGHIAGKHIIFK